VNEDLAILESDGKNLGVDFLYISMSDVLPKIHHFIEAYLLTVARFAVFALSAVNERRVFRIETVQAVWLLIDESVVLWNKLPSRTIDRLVMRMKHRHSVLPDLEIYAKLSSISG
jgi:precorrin-3B methylase